MARTKITSSRTKIVKEDRIHDALTFSLKELIARDLFSSDFSDENCLENAYSTDLSKLDFYIDKYENKSKVIFNFSINNESASSYNAVSFTMFLVSGRSNDSGAEQYKVDGSITTISPNTIVEFAIPTSSDEFIFSEHIDGFSYANYVVYADINNNNIEEEEEETDEGGGVRSSGSGIIVSRKSETSISNKTRILMCKGKIIKTDVLYDLVETNFYE